MGIKNQLGNKAVKEISKEGLTSHQIQGLKGAQTLIVKKRLNSGKEVEIGRAQITFLPRQQRSRKILEALGDKPELYWELSKTVSPKKYTNQKAFASLQVYFWAQLYKIICQLAAEHAFEEIVILTTEEEFWALDFYGNWPILGNAYVSPKIGNEEEVLSIISITQLETAAEVIKKTYH